MCVALVACESRSFLSPNHFLPVLPKAQVLGPPAFGELPQVCLGFTNGWGFVGYHTKWWIT